MNPSIQFNKATSLAVLMSFILVCFGLSPQARATCQEGCLTNFNTVLGDDALLNNTTAGNTAFQALLFNTSGDNNTAVGYEALLNSNSIDNTAVGYDSLFSNTNGFDNTATGYDALFSNATGFDNT